MRGTSIRRGDAIDAASARERNGSAPRVKGPKEQVLQIYVQVNIEAAIEKAKKLGYNEEICRTWIKEFEFKTKIQSAYKKSGEQKALELSIYLIKRTMEKIIQKKCLKIG